MSKVLDFLIEVIELHSLTGSLKASHEHGALLRRVQLVRLTEDVLQRG